MIRFPKPSTIRRFSFQLAMSVGLTTCLASILLARSGPHQKRIQEGGPITKEVAARRLKRIPIIKAAIEQGEAFAGKKNCVMEFQQLRELKQFEPGSAFEYRVRITCESKETGDFEHGATIEVEGQNLNYGEALQDIDRLSFAMVG